jgi:TPR repeat protein
MGGDSMKPADLEAVDIPAADALLLKALKLADAGKHKAAFRLFLDGAQRGDPMAQVSVGVCFDSGEGVAKDLKQALYWYKRAWKNGAGTSACMNLASLYAGLDNRRQAVHWWRKAVALGDGDAALEFADYLTAQRARGWESEVKNLVRRAMRSPNITQYGAERAASWFDAK